MTKIIFGTEYVSEISSLCLYDPSPEARALSCHRGKKLLAGAVYDRYNGSTVGVHISVSSPPTPEWFVHIFDYPFSGLRARKLVGQVRSDNPRALALDRHFGFVEEAKIRQFFDEDVDLVVLTMTPSQCRILNSSRWSTTREEARRRFGEIEFT